MPVNNGSGERALDTDGIAEKFFASAELTVPQAVAKIRAELARSDSDSPPSKKGGVS